MLCLAKLAAARSAPLHALLMASSSVPQRCASALPPLHRCAAPTRRRSPTPARRTARALPLQARAPAPSQRPPSAPATQVTLALLDKLDRIHEALRLVLQNHEDKSASRHNPLAPPYVVVHPSLHVKHGSHHDNALLVWRFPPNRTTLAQATACRAATGCRKRRPTPTACSRRTLGRAAPRCPAGAQPANPGGQNAGVHNQELHTRALEVVC